MRPSSDNLSITGSYLVGMVSFVSVLPALPGAIRFNCSMTIASWIWTPVHFDGLPSGRWPTPTTLQVKMTKPCLCHHKILSTKWGSPYLYDFLLPHGVCGPISWVWGADSIWYNHVIYTCSCFFSQGFTMHISTIQHIYPGLSRPSGTLQSISSHMESS